MLCSVWLLSLQLKKFLAKGKEEEAQTTVTAGSFSDVKCERKVKNKHTAEHFSAVDCRGTDMKN